jgi:hypothetical protein
VKVKVNKKFINIEMKRIRKKRINCESDLLDSSNHLTGNIFNNSDAPVRFMEDVNYKMDEAEDLALTTYVMI